MFIQNQKLRRDVEKQPPLKARPMWENGGEQEAWDQGNGRLMAQRRAKSLQSISKEPPSPTESKSLC